MKFINVLTNEVVNVANLSIKDGRIFYHVHTNKPCGNKFFKRNICVVRDEDAENGTFLTCAEGWEIVKGTKGEGKSKGEPKQPKKQDGEPKQQPKQQPEQATDEPEPEPEHTDEVEQVNEPANDDANDANDANEQALIAAIKNLRGNVALDVNKVRQIVADELAKLVAGEPQKVARIKLSMPANKDENRKLIDMVKAMVVNDRIIGRYPWLYGPAGSGKSTLCRQIADELGLPFYSVSSLQQKYELEGYTDAAGELVKTSFYHAFKNGGIFCFDEASTSSAEVQVAFNTAAAQLIYNFPKDGMIDAHPDFHIIAADNSMGRGGDRKYSARYKLDVSTLDRYTFVEVGYSPAHDLNMACGDAELVDFIKAIRVALDEANTEYIASPRASKAIKALQEMGMNDEDAVWYGLCSGWKKQDIRTFAARLKGFNKYFVAFANIVEKL